MGKTADKAKQYENLAFLRRKGERVDVSGPDAPILTKGWDGRVEKAEGEKPLTFRITDATVDGDMDSIDPNGVDVSRYLSNPVILWSHERGMPPVGTTKRLYQADNAWKAEPQFVDRDTYEFGWTIGQMAEKGLLNACSIGFRAKKDGYTVSEDPAREGSWGPGLDFSGIVLLEWSPCTIGSNPSALAERSITAGIPMKSWVEVAMKVLDREKGPGKWLSNVEAEKLYKAAANPPFYSIPTLAKEIVEQTEAKRLERVAAKRARKAKRASGDVTIEDFERGLARSATKFQRVITRATGRLP